MPAIKLKSLLLSPVQRLFVHLYSETVTPVTWLCYITKRRVDFINLQISLETISRSFCSFNLSPKSPKLVKLIFNTSWLTVFCLSVSFSLYDLTPPLSLLLPSARCASHGAPVNTHCGCSPQHRPWGWGPGRGRDGERWQCGGVSSCGGASWLHKSRTESERGEAGEVSLDTHVVTHTHALTHTPKHHREEPQRKKKKTVHLMLNIGCLAYLSLAY